MESSEELRLQIQQQQQIIDKLSGICKELRERLLRKNEELHKQTLELDACKKQSNELQRQKSVLFEKLSQMRGAQEAIQKKPESKKPVNRLKSPVRSLQHETYPQEKTSPVIETEDGSFRMNGWRDSLERASSEIRARSEKVQYEEYQLQSRIKIIEQKTIELIEKAEQLQELEYKLQQEKTPECTCGMFKLSMIQGREISRTNTIVNRANSSTFSDAILSLERDNIQLKSRIDSLELENKNLESKIVQYQSLCHDLTYKLQDVMDSRSAQTKEIDFLTTKIGFLERRQLGLFHRDQNITSGSDCKPSMTLKTIREERTTGSFSSSCGTRESLALTQSPRDHAETSDQLTESDPPLPNGPVLSNQINYPKGNAKATDARKSVQGIKLLDDGEDFEDIYQILDSFESPNRNPKQKLLSGQDITKLA